jgi:hypothetical protein
MTRDGKMNDAEFGTRMRGTGGYAKFVKEMFDKTCKRLGLNENRPRLTTEHFRRRGERTLFD